MAVAAEHVQRVDRVIRQSRLGLRANNNKPFASFVVLGSDPKQKVAMVDSIVDRLKITPERVIRTECDQLRGKEALQALLDASSAFQTALKTLTKGEHWIWVVEDVEVAYCKVRDAFAEVARGNYKAIQCEDAKLFEGCVIVFKANVTGDEALASVDGLRRGNINRSPDVPKPSLIVKKLKDLQGTPADIGAKEGQWRSRRFLTREHNFGFSYHDTVIKAGTETYIHYANHLEAVYCVAGNGELFDIETGITHKIEDGTMYCLAGHERHFLRGGTEDMRMVCVFNPPVVGVENHDDVGVYPLLSPGTDAVVNALCYHSLMDWVDDVLLVQPDFPVGGPEDGSPVRFELTETINGIVNHVQQLLSKRFQAISVVIDDAARGALCSTMRFDFHAGTRPLKQFLEAQLMDAVTALVDAGRIAETSTVIIDKGSGPELNIRVK